MPVLLFGLFVVVPVLELALILAVGHLIGGWWTVGLLLLSALLGSWLLRREGRRAWFAFRTALAQGRLPTAEVADGALVIFGAALMVAPGFLTDLIGMLCLLPPSRAVLRRVLATTAMRRILFRAANGRPATGARSGPESHFPSRSHPPIIDGELDE